MVALTLLEKTSNRLITKVRVRNLHPQCRYTTELNAMVDLLKNMDFQIDFDWNEETTAITKIRVTFEGVTAERIA